jgi:transmembrane sensor
MDHERFWLLISRKLAGEASPSDLAELEQLIASNETLRVKYHSLSTYWFQNKPANDSDSDAAFRRTMAKIRAEETQASGLIPDPVPVTNQPAPKTAVHKKLTPLPYWLKIAAILLLVVGLSYFSYEYLSNLTEGNSAWIEKRNGEGTQSKITLPDGSIVWLNADSRILYARNFTENRNVQLSGEAFFEVTRNPDKPFTIQLNASAIRVLGTSFNVKAYDNEETIETSVVSGTVAFIPEAKVTANATEIDGLLLTPNVKAVYSRKTGKVVKEDTNSALDKAWLEGKLIFKAMRLEEIGKVLTRIYGKPVHFANDSLKHCRLTATFQNDSLEEILFFLSKTKDFQYKIDAERVLISGSGCLPE